MNINNCQGGDAGLYAFFFDEEFVCIGLSQGRRSVMKLKWISIEMAKKVREFIENLQGKYGHFDIDLIIDGEIPDELIN